MKKGRGLNVITHTIRTKNGKTKKVQLTARTAIMSFCKECVGFVETDVRPCTDKLCPLFLFRLRDTVPKDMRKKKKTGKLKEYFEDKPLRRGK